MDKLKKYISGELSEEELDDFSRELISAKLDRDKKAAWKQKLADDYKVHRSSDPTPTNSSNKIGLVVAFVAGLLLVALLVFLFTKPKPQPQPKAPVEKVVQEYIAALDIMSDQSTLLRGDETEIKERILANEAYAEKDYANAISNWELLANKTELNKLDYFYLGVSYLQQTNSQVNLAIQNLVQSKVLQGPTEEINWVLSLAYLEANQPEKAKALLTNIVANKAFMHQKAAQLLSELE